MNPFWQGAIATLIGAVVWSLLSHSSEPHWRGGYQPTGPELDVTRPPQGGSGVPPKPTGPPNELHESGSERLVGYRYCNPDGSTVVLACVRCQKPAMRRSNWCEEHQPQLKSRM